MKFYQIFKDKPFIPSRKCNAAAAAGGIAESMLGGIFSLAAQAETDRVNYRIAQENRQMQIQENQKSRDWNERMWNLQNEYNSPANQRRLYEEGGYNPYLLGKENLGSGAGFAGSPAQNALPSPAHMVGAAPYISEMFSHGSSDVANFMRLANESKQVQANLELQKIEGIQRLMAVELEVYKTSGQKGVNQLREQFGPVFKALNYEGSYFEQRQALEFKQIDLKNQYQEVQNSIVKQFGEKESQKKLDMLDKQMAYMQQQIYTLKSQSRLNDAQAYRVGSEVARNLAQAGLFNAQTGQINALLPYIVSVWQDDVLRSDMDLSNKQALFASEEGVRRHMKSKAVKDSKGLQYSTENNYVSSLLKGVSSVIGEVGKNIAPWSSWKPKASTPSVLMYGDY